MIHDKANTGRTNDRNVEMSFGANPSDIAIVVNLCKALYRKCRDAGGEYDETSREVRALHTVLKHLKYEVEAPESPLNHDRSLWGRRLSPTIGHCDDTLRELDALLQKYGRISGSVASSPSSPRALWDRMRHGSHEMDTLGSIRVKLITHKNSLTQFLDTVQLDQSGKMQQKLDNHAGQLDTILDKVDTIAARMGQGSRSVMTSYEDDDKEVWKQFRRELVQEGFSSEVLMQHKDILRAYIREIDQKGLLDENPQSPHSTIADGGVNPERWLEAVQSTGSVNKQPPRFSTLGLATDDGAKEMMVNEDNMKFPASMKLDRQKPEDERPLEPRAQLTIPEPSKRDRRASSNTSRPRQPSPVPKLITTPSQSFYSDKEVVPRHSTTDSDSDPSASSKQLSRSLGTMIRTSDLLATTLVPSLIPASPLSYRSQSSNYGSSYDHDTHQSMVSRPKKSVAAAAVEYGSSPISTSALPIPIPIPAPNSSTPQTSANNVGAGTNLKLAPDSRGKETPPDALWTRINRRLVSPEVLQQDGRRYEARPEFVAVLGTLTREEIEEYAARSQVLRENRWRYDQPSQNRDGAREGESQQAPQPYPQQGAIPTPMPMPKSTGPRVRFGRDTPSSSSDSSSSDSSSESSSDDSRRRRRRRGKSRGAHSTVSSNVGPVSGYPNPYGGPPSPPPTSRGDRDEKRENHRREAERDSERKERDRERDSERKERERERERERDRHSDYTHDREREKDSYRHSKSTHDKEDDAHRRHRHHHHPSHSSSHHASSHNKHDRASSTASRSNGDKGKSAGSEKSRGSGRWKENLTAAGMGGAAVSLLHVLSEAAEGI